MHYCVIVVVDRPEKNLIDAALAKYQDERWDWYRVGGRWTGWIKEIDYSAQQRNSDWHYSDAAERMEDNAIPTAELKTRGDKVPYAVVIDGAWHEKASAYSQPDFPGWDDADRDQYKAISERCDREWAIKFAELVQALPDDKFAVVVDCHN